MSQRWRQKTRATQTSLVMLLVIIFATRIVQAEISSILEGATVLGPSNTNPGETPDQYVVIGPGFKSHLGTLNSDAKGDGSYDVEIQITLSQPRTIRTAFVLANYEHINNVKRIGNTAFWVGNDPNPYSTSLT